MRGKCDTSFEAHMRHLVKVPLAIISCDHFIYWQFWEAFLSQHVIGGKIGQIKNGGVDAEIVTHFYFSKVIREYCLTLSGNLDFSSFRNKIKKKRK